MIPRTLSVRILENLDFFPIVGIIGPRQVGKTTLAKSLEKQLDFPTIYLDLELESDLRKLDDAETYLRFQQDKCIIIDEIQRLPRLFPLMRALVDEDRRPGRFIILGSASPELIRGSSETLAGRIAYLELTPLTFQEVNPSISMRTHWLKGGFPDPLLASKPEFTWRWYNNFLRTFIERDLRELGYEISAPMLRRMFSMLGHVHSQLLNVSDLSRSLGVSAPTVNRYLDLLEGSFIIQRLQPYFRNIGKRLVKSPKIYFRDSGLLHSVLNIRSLEALLGHISVGASWEGYVIEEIRRIAPAECEQFFYRTHTGAEIDLLLILPSGKTAAIEIKSTNAPKISRGFHQSCADLNPDKKYIITPDSDPYPKDQRIEVVNAPHFLEQILPDLLV